MRVTAVFFQECVPTFDRSTSSKVWVFSARWCSTLCLQRMSHVFLICFRKERSDIGLSITGLFCPDPVRAQKRYLSSFLNTAPCKSWASKGHCALSDWSGFWVIHDQRSLAKLSGSGTHRGWVLPFTCGMFASGKPLPWGSMFLNQFVLACLAASARSPKQSCTSRSAPAHGAWHSCTTVAKNSETCSVLSASLPPRLFTTFFLQSSKCCWLQNFTNRAWGLKDLQQDSSTSARLRANGLFLQSVVLLRHFALAQNMPIDRPFRLPGPLCGPLLLLRFGGFAMAWIKYRAGLSTLPNVRNKLVIS